MLPGIIHAFLIVGSGWASALLLAGWILAIERQTGDDRMAIGAVVIALAAGGAGLLWPGPGSRRSPKHRLLLRGGLAALAAGGGFLAADRLAPALLGHALVLGLLVHAVLLVPAGLLLGVLMSGLAGLDGRTGGRRASIRIGLLALGAAGGLLASPVHLLHAVGLGVTGSVLAGAVVLLLAGLTASLLVPPRSTPPRVGAGNGVPDPDDGRRIFGDAACAAVGLGLGLTIFVVGRYGGILVPAAAPAWSLATGFFLAGFAGFAILAALFPDRSPRITPALALAAATATAFVIAWDWSRLVEALGTLPGDTASDAAIGSASGSGPFGRMTLEAIGRLLRNGGGAAALAVGAACALVLRGAQPDRDAGDALRRGLAWIVGGAAAGVATATLLAPVLEWQVWMIPAWLIGVGAGLTALATRWPFPVRAALAILVVGALTVGMARNASDMNPPSRGSARTTFCAPFAWIEINEVPGPRRRQRVRIDRRLTFETRLARAATTREREVALPLRLRPGAKRLLLLDETLGLASATALRHSELRVDVTWLVDGLDRYFGPSLAGRASRSGREIRLHSLSGRTVLATHPGAFDVIVGLESGGRTDRPAGPVTVEHLRAARSALRPGGVFCQWLRFDRLSTDEIRSIGRAFHAVFPRSASIVLPSLDPAYPAAGLVGTSTDEPLRLTPLAGEVRDRGIDPAAGADPLDLLAYFVAGAPLLDPPEGARAPTDDRPFLRFSSRSAGRDADRGRGLELYAALLEPRPLRALPRIDGPGAPAPAVRDEALGAARSLRLAHLARLEAAAGLGSASDALQAALGACRDALERTPDRPFVRENVGEVGRALLAVGRREEAGALFDLAMERAPAWAGGYLGKAMVLFERRAVFRTLDDWKPIESLAEKALALDRRRALAWIYLGIINYRAHYDAAAARGCLEKAAMIDPDDPLLKSYLWLFIDQDGRTEEATRMLLDAVEAFPDEERLWDALYKQVPRLLLAKKRGQALFVLRRIEPRYRDDAGYYLALSEVYEAMGDLEKAVDAARRCCKATEPPVQGYYLRLYTLLKRTAQEREAHELRGYIENTFGIDPDVVLAK